LEMGAPSAPVTWPLISVVICCAAAGTATEVMAKGATSALEQRRISFFTRHPNDFCDTSNQAHEGG
jgi:hypothetical protein